MASVVTASDIETIISNLVASLKSITESGAEYTAQEDIQFRNLRIKEIREEINAWQRQLDALNAEKRSLQVIRLRSPS